MSLIFKCDMCGKDSTMTGVSFSQLPLTITVKNYKNDNIIVMLNVVAYQEDDYHLIDKVLSDTYSSQTPYDKEEDGNYENDQDVAMISIRDNATPQEVIATLKRNGLLKIADPCLCDFCKRQMASFSMKAKPHVKEGAKTYITEKDNFTDDLAKDITDDDINSNIVSLDENEIICKTQLVLSDFYELMNTDNVDKIKLIDTIEIGSTVFKKFIVSMNIGKYYVLQANKKDEQKYSVFYFKDNFNIVEAPLFFTSLKN